MQQKPSFSGLGIAALLGAIVLLVGLTALMMAQVPAPQHHIEKQLDAKDFLEQKQP